MKITDIIFCDDIRFELNGKLSLMGLYHDEIIFHYNQEPPTKEKLINSKIALLLRFKVEKNEPAPNRFVFEYSLKGIPIAKVEGNVKIEPNQTTMSLALLSPMLTFEPGYLGFKINLLDQETSVFSYESKEAIKISINLV